MSQPKRNPAAATTANNHAAGKPGGKRPAIAVRIPPAEGEKKEETPPAAAPIGDDLTIEAVLKILADAGVQFFCNENGIAFANIPWNTPSPLGMHPGQVAEISPAAQRFGFAEAQRAHVRFAAEADRPGTGVAGGRGAARSSCQPFRRSDGRDLYRPGRRIMAVSSPDARPVSSRPGDGASLLSRETPASVARAGCRREALAGSSTLGDSRPEHGAARLGVASRRPLPDSAGPHFSFYRRTGIGQDHSQPTRPQPDRPESCAAFG